MRIQDVLEKKIGKIEEHSITYASAPAQMPSRKEKKQ
jgi:hypothetical protein